MSSASWQGEPLGSSRRSVPIRKKRYTKDYLLVHRETYVDFFGYVCRCIANRIFPK